MGTWLVAVRKRRFKSEYLQSSTPLSFQDSGFCREPFPIHRIYLFSMFDMQIETIISSIDQADLKIGMNSSDVRTAKFCILYILLLLVCS